MNKSAETTKYYLAVKLYNRNVLYAANKNSNQVSHFSKILVWRQYCLNQTENNIAESYLYLAISQSIFTMYLNTFRYFT